MNEFCKAKYILIFFLEQDTSYRKEINKTKNYFQNLNILCTSRPKYNNYLMTPFYQVLIFHKSRAASFGTETPKI